MTKIILRLENSKNRTIGVFEIRFHWTGQANEIFPKSTGMRLPNLPFVTMNNAVSVQIVIKFPDNFLQANLPKIQPMEFRKTSNSR